MEQKGQYKGHLLPGDPRGRKSQDSEKKQLRKGYSISGDQRDRDRQVRIWTERAEGYSLSGDHRGRHKSGHRKKVTEQGVLTDWRPQRKEQVRIWKEGN